MKEEGGGITGPGMQIGHKPSTVSRRRFAVACAALPGLAWAAAGADAQEIDHSAEAVHEVATFNASPARVYATLTESARFTDVVRHSAALASPAMRAMMTPGAPLAEIENRPGGRFSLFGGIISGYQLDLAPGVRIVEAWRVSYWRPGEYSIVRFTLAGAGGGTQVMLEHGGFPQGEAQSLADGWRKNYWEPMTRYFAAS